MGDLSDAAFAGVHTSEQGDLSDRSQADVWWECVKGAVADAGLDLADVDGLTGRAPHGVGIRDALPGGAVAAMIGRPLRSMPSLTSAPPGRHHYRPVAHWVERSTAVVCAADRRCGVCPGASRMAGIAGPGQTRAGQPAWAVSAQRQIPHVDATRASDSLG